MKRKNIFILIAVLLIAFSSCNDDDNASFVLEGQWAYFNIRTIPGFEEEKATLLQKYGATDADFVRVSTDSAWALSAEDQTLLRNIRDGVSRPDGNTLLQKIIPLEDIFVYMNNIYGGTVGGFVCEAADVKSLHTMAQVYHGLRLDYAGTKFKADGAGYAVIRFYSNATSHLSIPYVAELGGKQSHSWPNGGGGFTTSTLGEGGYPEWIFDGYNAPEEGAELYEVTPQGREILRSVFKNGKWQTYESEYLPVPPTSRGVEQASCMTVRNGMYSDGFIKTVCQYRGHTFVLRAEAGGYCHLTTTEQLSIEGMTVIDKGIYGISVPRVEVCDIREIKAIIN